MKQCNWVTVKQDLKTLVCQRCGNTHTMSVSLPAPINEYLAILRAAEKSFTTLHEDCVAKESDRT